MIGVGDLNAQWNVVIAPLATAFGVTLLATPVVRAAARRYGFVAAPSTDRWHQRPTALLGGVAIFVGCAVAVCTVVLLGRSGHVASATVAANKRLLGIIASSFLMFGTGIADDIWKFRPATKLVLQVVAASILVSSGVILPLLPWTTLNIMLTLGWFIFMTNALNLLDNMDGVAVGVGGIAAFFLAVTFVLQGQWLLAGTCLAVTGAAAGFLPYNFHRASIFMGDSGSLMIGSLLAGLGAAFPAGVTGSVFSVIFVPALIVIIPIADTMLVSTTRTLAGRSVTVGGRDHTSHRLVAMGLSEPQVALILYAFSAMGGSLAIVLQVTRVGYGLWIGLLFLIGLFTFAAYLSKLHSYPAEEVTNSPRFTVVVSNLLYKGRMLEALLDMVLFCLAYYGSYLLRYEGAIPGSQVVVFQKTLALVVASYMGAFALTGVYRGAWQQASLADLHRVLKGVLLGAFIASAAIVMAFRHEEFSRSVLIINGLTATLLAIGVRVSFRSFETLHITNRRSGGTPTLIYGAGKGGELLVRELRANNGYGLEPVGFIDDDPHKHGLLIHGLPVIGGLRELAKLGPVPRTVLIGSRSVGPERVEELRQIVASRQTNLLTFDLVIRDLEDGRQIIARSSQNGSAEVA